MPGPWSACCKHSDICWLSGSSHVCWFNSLSFSLANSQGPCLPLLKPHTINSPFSLSISAPSLYPPPPSTSEFSAEIVQQVINVPQMGNIDLGSIQLHMYATLPFVLFSVGLYCFSLQVVVQTVVSIMNFILSIFRKNFFFLDYWGYRQMKYYLSLDSWIKYKLC